MTTRASSSPSDVLTPQQPQDKTPAIAVSMGDPAGIGPEVLLRALNGLDRRGWPMIRVFGDLPRLEELANALALPGITSYSGLTLVDCPVTPAPSQQVDATRAAFAPGSLSDHGAAAQVSYIQQALDDIAEGRSYAIVTGPIHKQALARCGLPYHGHTEWLADFADVDVTMMLAGPKLRAVPATCHIPLSAVPEALTEALILQSIVHTHETLQRWFGIEAPKIAVCGLNPHAGDEGLLGTEDEEVVAPAIAAAQAQGILATGPYPGDTIFYFAHQGHYDAVVAMYHDQALGPLKLVHFDDAINLTMGLPFIRTSVDHGTAYDIAAQGIANPSSMIEALTTAARMAVRA